MATPRRLAQASAVNTASNAASVARAARLVAVSETALADSKAAIRRSLVLLRMTWHLEDRPDRTAANTVEHDA